MTKDNPLNLPISPLPWVKINTQIADNDFFAIGELYLATDRADANAAYIVRCCNMHQELIQALNGCADVFSTWEHKEAKKHLNKINELLERAKHGN